MNHRIAWMIVWIGATNLLAVAVGDETKTEPAVEQRGGDEDPRLRPAIERSLALLEKASAGSAEQRVCFTCHNQALPVFTLAKARRRGFSLDEENFQQQIEHTYKHLRRGRKSYTEGKGQGGGVDTAGYALWTLEEGQREPEEVTQLVTDWLLDKQHKDGKWKCSSNRPPSEASHFTTTYLAIRALSVFAVDEKPEEVDQAYQNAASWLKKASPDDTEGRVFRLLSLAYLDTDRALLDAEVKNLIGHQRDDGGWAQLDEMESDAYATGTVLYALQQCGVSAQRPAWKAGIDYLLESQNEDGSWHVVSRSKPFQKYFESGFPHGKDQFISTAASGWATIALLASLPQNPSADD